MVLLSLALVASLALAAPVEVKENDVEKRFVDETYPYVGPEIPIGDIVDQTPNGNGKGFIRLREPPAVRPPLGVTVTNNINVISTAYAPGGMIVHFQTPFGIGGEPCVAYGTSKDNLDGLAKGNTRTYDRTPPCSIMDPTQCSQFFHDVQLKDLQPGTTYYYQIPGGNGTVPSEVMSFATAKSAGDQSEFTVAVLCDMGYTNAMGTHAHLTDAIADDTAFVWHGGDISYADQWYGGILECDGSWPLCYNGSESKLPGGKVDNPDYYTPLPEGEVPNEGTPRGGDISTMYETNWDLWQQWMNAITKHAPYMVAPGNHEATCAEFDGSKNQLSAILDQNKAPGSTAPNKTITYYSCPPSQRNFTAYQHRFGMPGDVSGGVGNFWYSFDYGLAHFVTLNGETDYYKSPEWSFLADNKGVPGVPAKNRTFITDSGPFGRLDGNYTDNKNYEQYQWLVKDLQSVDRSKTPWIFVMSHRPMYSSETAAYQANMRNAFEDLLLEYKVDAYLSGHIHWYERLWPLGKNGTIDNSAIVSNHTYKMTGKSITHLVNGQAGNLESHSTIEPEKVLNITAARDQVNYGFSRLTVHNATAASWEFVKAADGGTGDYLFLVKE